MIKFVVCTWNASNFIENCIRSIMSQLDKNFEVYIIDDLSEDDTVMKIKSLIKDDSRFNLIVNKEKKFKLKNLDDLISSFNDDDIIIELDGDDYLNTNDVVSDFKTLYSDGNVWLTNGSFVFTDGRLGFSQKCNPNTIRQDIFKFSHIRTWKCFLWKNIPKECFKDINGEYFKSAPDVAYTFPLIELSGEEHYRFLSKIYYVYNDKSIYNEHKNNSAAGGISEQQRCANIVRKMPKLNKLQINLKTNE